MRLSRIIAEELTRQGLTQKQLAEKCNIKPQLISRYISEQAEPVFSTGIAILNALNYDLDKLSTHEQTTDTIETNAAMLNTNLALFFDVSTDKIDLSRIVVNPETEEEAEEFLEEEVIIFTAKDNFKMDNIKFTKGDTVTLDSQIVSDIVDEINRTVLQKQKKFYSNICMQVTQKYLKEDLLSNYYIHKNIMKRTGKTASGVSLEELKELRLGRKEISVKQLLSQE